MTAVERAVATERLAEVAGEIVERELGSAMEKLTPSQLFRALELAGEEDGCRLLESLAGHQLGRSTMKPPYRTFWKAIQDVAGQRDPAVAAYLQETGGRQELEPWEFRRLVEFLVVEVLWRKRQQQAPRGGRGRGR